MSQELNNDPLIGKLTQFNPATGSMDRDAMLFAAGRASAPRPRGWQALAGTLACSQAVMLAAWLTLSGAEIQPAQPGTKFAEAPPVLPVAQSSVRSLAIDSYGNMMRQVAEGTLPSPMPVEDSGSARSILSAHSSSLESLVE
jgi:hypothetical protein